MHKLGLRLLLSLILIVPLTGLAGFATILVLVDFAMPGMNGAEVARQVQARRPALPVLFVTGFADRSALAAIGEAHIIGKPFVADELADKVRAALAPAVAENVVRLRR